MKIARAALLLMSVLILLAAGCREPRNTITGLRRRADFVLGWVEADCSSGVHRSPVTRYRSVGVLKVEYA